MPGLGFLVARRDRQGVSPVGHTLPHECYDNIHPPGVVRRRHHGWSSLQASRTSHCTPLPYPNVQGQDDFAMLQGGVRAQAEGDETGGPHRHRRRQGQLNMFLRALEELGRRGSRWRHGQGTAGYGGPLLPAGQEGRDQAPGTERKPAHPPAPPRRGAPFRLEISRQLRSGTSASSFEDIPGIGEEGENPDPVHRRHERSSTISAADLLKVRD